MTLDEALVWADRTRAYRGDFLQRCAAGMSFADVRAELARESDLGLSDDTDRLNGLRLLPVLEAMPSVGGKVASRRLLASASLPGDVHLAEVSDEAWSLLLGASPTAYHSGGVAS